ncbi:MAG: type I restriction endonuclease subunit R [Flammeovirgaceae bacterium]|jgi:type I restriction enzyme R subunit|nr:type I restriction endonuclease subunit R [Flammeovirgaceae bacterium]
MQSEAILEQALMSQLHGLGYSFVPVHDGDTLLANLKSQLERFNKTSFTAKEFDAVLNHLAKGNVFEKAKTLRDRFNLTKEDGTTFYVRFFNNEDWSKNLYQVTNQVQQQGSFLNRYDVTLLVNGLPLVQIELKRKGIEIKEAFNQINRYQKHSFWSNNGLFQYVQVFVISNGTNTKYLANNPLQSVMQTFYWSDVNNKITSDLTSFANAFLNTDHLGKFISHYVVQNETFKNMMILRPYQYYAVEAIIHQVKSSNSNGYIWHTTGSGKTLTSFKASQIIMDLPEVYKVVFVVDRKDLDYQTMNEFNAFKKDSVDVTNNTASLVRQLTDDTKLVLTTIQKLNNAISKAHFENKLTHLRDKKVVFIFDECHRSQFGDTHERITNYFQKAQLFGFTGTPIFADNATKNEHGKRTTRDLFGGCLHKYVITDAIRDQNVLRFGIEYIGKYKQKGNTFMDIEVEDIDRPEVYADEKRLAKIVDYIIAYHDQKTFNREFSALFAISSIDTLVKYYEIFKKKKEAGEHDLRVATIFTYGANEDDEDAQDNLPGDELAMAAEAKENYKSKHSREKLNEFIRYYNSLYGTAFSTDDDKLFEGYFKDISKRLKEREKETFNDEKDRLDILLVVNMFLTGFDAKKVNTLYVDKNLRHHGLIQSYSRTNRILGEKKSQGNILAFRNLKDATDKAITLFSNKEAIEEIILPPFEAIAKRFDEALAELHKLVPTPQSVDNLVSEEEEAAFIQAFRALLRAKNVLESYTDFSWAALGIDEDTFLDYQTKYIDLYAKVKRETAKQKTSILNDIDFEVELIHRDIINVAYIIKLLAKLKQAKKSEREQQKKAIMDLLGSDVQLRSKRELIEKFIEENLPRIENADSIQEEFEQYWQDQKVLALAKLCDDEQLDKEQFKALIDTYIFSGQEPLRDDVLKCLGNRPSILRAREVGERIINKMKEFVEVFVQGMVA